MPEEKSSSKSLIKRIFLPIIYIIIGIIIGGYLFSDTQPRSFLAVHKCSEKTCLSTKDLAGLVASVGISKVPNLMPYVVLETDKTLIIKHPFPAYPIHYVAIPKKDIKDAAHLSSDDQAYLVDAYAAMSELIREKNIKKYKIITNGPGYQQVTYLHFHIIGR